MPDNYLILNYDQCFLLFSTTFALRFCQIWAQAVMYLEHFLSFQNCNRDRLPWITVSQTGDVGLSCNHFGLGAASSVSSIFSDSLSPPLRLQFLDVFEHLMVFPGFCGSCPQSLWPSIFCAIEIVADHSLTKCLVGCQFQTFLSFSPSPHIVPFFALLSDIGVHVFRINHVFSIACFRQGFSSALLVLFYM